MQRHDHKSTKTMPYKPGIARVLNVADREDFKAALRLLLGYGDGATVESLMGNLVTIRLWQDIAPRLLRRRV